MLTIPNGERFKFGTNVHFIFEVENLDFASPATVSRLGVVHLSVQDLDASLLVDTWLLQLPNEIQEKIQCQMEKVCPLSSILVRRTLTETQQIFQPCLKWLMRNALAVTYETSIIATVQGCLSLIPREKTLQDAEFAFYIYLGFGAHLKDHMRPKLWEILVETVPGISVPLPSLSEMVGLPIILTTNLQGGFIHSNSSSGLLRFTEST